MIFDTIIIILLLVIVTFVGYQVFTNNNITISQPYLPNYNNSIPPQYMINNQQNGYNNINQPNGFSNQQIAYNNGPQPASYNLKTKPKSSTKKKAIKHVAFTENTDDNAQLKSLNSMDSGLSDLCTNL